MSDGQKTTDRDLGRRRIIKELGKVEDAQVKVGWWGGTEEGGKASLAEIALYNERGTEHSPARPAVAQAFDENQDDYTEVIEDGYDDILRGRGTVRQILTELAIRVRGDIQKRMTALRKPKNADSTIEQKPGDNPLVALGTLRSGVLFEVED